jgi:hypothetical protein
VARVRQRKAHPREVPRVGSCVPRKRRPSSSETWPTRMRAHLQGQCTCARLREPRLVSRPRDLHRQVGPRRILQSSRHGPKEAHITILEIRPEQRRIFACVSRTAHLKRVSIVPALRALPHPPTEPPVRSLRPNPIDGLAGAQPEQRGRRAELSEETGEGPTHFNFRSRALSKAPAPRLPSAPDYLERPPLFLVAGPPPHRPHPQKSALDYEERRLWKGRL